MNKLKYDVVTLGNHEFDYKIPQLEELNEKLNCGYISINYCLHETKTAIYNSSKIIEKGGKKNCFYWSSYSTNFIKNIFKFVI